MDDSGIAPLPPAPRIAPQVPVNMSGGKTKESGSFAVETPKVVEKPVEQAEEIPTQVELEKKPELSGYMEKVEREAELMKPVQDDYTQQVLIKSANPQNVTVTLPMTEDEMMSGLHGQVWESFRWLAEWCVRQIKLLHGKVKYKGEE